MHVRYLEGESPTNHNDVISALRGYGYNVVNYAPLQKNVVANSIIASKPVYMDGNYGLYTDKQHAWVCEGYQSTHYNGILATIPNKPLVRYTESPIDMSLQQGNQLFYMAFGEFRQVGNGWYSISSNNINNMKCLIINK